MPLKLVQPKENRSEIVLRHLEDLLASGRFAPGAKLPTERALSVELAVPRGAVREALAVLETRGQVIRAVGSGTFVSEIASAGADVSGYEQVRVFYDASPREIMDARFVLEPRLAFLVASNATAADFSRLEETLRQGETADTYASFDAADDAFHQAIAEATHNRLVVDVYAAIGAARRRAAWGNLRRRFLTPERRIASRREHRAIFNCLTARHVVEAEAAILKHLREINTTLIEGHAPSLLTPLKEGSAE
ncbi:MAG: FadR family transcriptional regulator [Rhizobiales bacterium]|nr:FadR family transcriptional regulator [Hyphomicrobiales bacterium]